MTVKRKGVLKITFEDEASADPISSPDIWIANSLTLRFGQLSIVIVVPQGKCFFFPFSVLLLAKTSVVVSPGVVDAAITMCRIISRYVRVLCGEFIQKPCVFL